MIPVDIALCVPVGATEKIDWSDPYAVVETDAWPSAMLRVHFAYAVPAQGQWVELEFVNAQGGTTAAQLFVVAVLHRPMPDATIHLTALAHVPGYGQPHEAVTLENARQFLGVFSDAYPHPDRDPIAPPQVG